MQITKLLRAYQGVIVSIIILIVSGLGIIFGVVPILQKTIVMNTDINNLSKEIEALKNKVSVLESVDEGSLRNNAQVLLSAVPSDKSVPTLLWTLDGLTAKTGVGTGNFLVARLGSLATESAKRVTADEQEIGGNILPFTVNITGSLDQLRGFLASTVSVRRLLRIRTLGVSFQKTGSESTGSANMVTAILGMDTFYSPLPTTIGSVSQPLTPLTSTDDDLVAKVAAMQLMETTTLQPPLTGAARPDPFGL